MNLLGIVLIKLYEKQLIKVSKENIQKPVILDCTSLQKSTSFVKKKKINE